MRRRHLLTTIAAATALPLTGCIGGGRPGETPTPGTPTGSLQVHSRQCGQGEDRASVTVNTDAVVVTGTIGGSDTCDTAALESVERRDDTLAVSVVTRRVDTPGTPVCAQCLTDIEYEARVTGVGRVSSVVVTHDGTTVTRTTV